MKLMHLGAAFAIAVLGILATASPLQSAPYNRSSVSDIPTPVINGIFNIEPDFFDRGREQFDQEIEHLIRGDFDSDLPVLTVDESIQFTPEIWERLQGESNTHSLDLTSKYL